MSQKVLTQYVTCDIIKPSKRREIKSMSKKGKKKGRSENHLSNVLLATAIIELLSKIAELIQAVID